MSTINTSDYQQSTNWLDATLQQSSAISGFTIMAPEFEPIRNYGLIWNLFERSSVILLGIKEDERYNEEDLAERITQSISIDDSLINEVFDFFVNRYIKEKDSDKRFNNLWPNKRSAAYRKDILEVLRKDKPSEVEMNRACGMICLRLRNNLFHGIKEIKDLKEQTELFVVANHYLEAMIDKMGLIEV